MQEPELSEYSLTPQLVDLAKKTLKEAEKFTARVGFGGAVVVVLIWYNIFINEGSIWQDSELAPCALLPLLIIYAIIYGVVWRDKIVSWRTRRYSVLIQNVESFQVSTREFEEERRNYAMWLIRTRKEFWQSLTGHEFEHEIASLYSRMGYLAMVTRGSGDKGVDIFMEKDGESIIAQCKQHKRPIGPAVARELLGALIDHSAKKALLVCTGGFTQGVVDFVHDKDIELVGIDEIIKYQKELDGMVEKNDNINFMIEQIAQSNKKMEALKAKRRRKRRRR